MAHSPSDEGAPTDLLQQMLEDARREHAKEIHGEPVGPAPALLDLRVAAAERPSQREVLLAEIDQKISMLVDEVLQDPTVQRLAEVWTALWYLVEHVDLEENLRVAFINCSKDDLASDFEDAIDVTVSGLYRQLCDPGHQPSDGAPVSLIVADYDFDHHQQDVELLRHCAAVAADAHAPFLANASPGFIATEGPRYAAWDSFCDSEDARYVALCSPVNESAGVRASHDFAVQIAETFANHRWFDELSDSVGSAQRPRRFADTPEGNAMALDSLAGARLSNVLNISRIAHFIEALGRELGVEQSASSLERALQQWLRDQVPGARVSVSQGDYYRYELELHPSSAEPGVTVRVAGSLGESE